MRRGWACEACRTSKVRCDQPDMNVPCKRCSKAERKCVSFKSSHKNLKSTGKLKDLRERIDGLIATLPRGDSVPPSVANILGTKEHENEDTPNTAVIQQPRLQDLKPNSASPASQDSTKAAPILEYGADYRQNLLPPMPAASSLSITSDLFEKAYQSSIPSDGRSPSAIIRTGIAQIISPRTAEAIMNRYRTELTAQFPAVVLPDLGASTTFEPSSTMVLRLAILSAASGGICDTDTQKRLQRLQAIVLGHCIHQRSEYTLELVQAMIVSALWFTPSESKEDQNAMNIRQLSQSMSDIAVEIGLHKPLVGTSKDMSVCMADGPNSGLSIMADLEAKRTWLACYYICANTSMPSQEPSLLGWNQYMNECLETLEASPLALPSDKYFCAHIRLQRLTDENSRHLIVSHFFKASPVSRPDTAGMLSNFKPQQLNMDNLTLDSSNKVTQILQNSSKLYIQEVFLCINRESDLVQSTLNVNLDVNSPQEELCSTTSTTSLLPERSMSAHAIISAFLSLSTRERHAMPSVWLVRVVHAFIIMARDVISSEEFSSGSSQSLCSSHLMPTDILRIFEDELEQMSEIFNGYGTEWPARRLAPTFSWLRWQSRSKNDNDVTDLYPLGMATAQASNSLSPDTSDEPWLQPDVFDTPPDLWDDFSLLHSRAKKSKVWHEAKTDAMLDFLPEAPIWIDGFGAEDNMLKGLSWQSNGDIGVPIDFNDVY